MSKIENLAQLLRDVASRTGWGPEMLERIEAAHEMLSRFTPAPIQYGDADVYLGVGLAQFKQHGSDSWVYGEAYVNQGGALFLRDAEGMAASFKRLDSALLERCAVRPDGGRIACIGNASRSEIEDALRDHLGPAEDSSDPDGYSRAAMYHRLGWRDAEKHTATERKPRTDAEIVAQTEALAAKLNEWRWGAELTSGNYRNSSNPKAQSCWQVACLIQEMLTDTDPENSAAEIDDQEQA